MSDRATPKATASAAHSASFEGNAAAPVAAQPASVEWDHKGRVVTCRLQNGNKCQFRYDQQGSLYAFTYARLAWNTMDGRQWSALDQHNTYSFQGQVSVQVDGTIQIKQTDLTRSIRISGLIIDEFANGTVRESLRETEDPAPGDLLAITQARPEDFPSMDDGGKTPRTPLPILKASLRVEPPDLPSAEKAERLQTQFDEPSAPGRKFIAQGIRMKRMREVEARAQAHDAACLHAPAQTKPASRFRLELARLVVPAIELLFGHEDPRLLPHLDLLAAAAHEQRRIDDARLLYERTLKLRRKALGDKDSDTGLSLLGLGRIYHEWGRYNEAEHYYLEAMRVFAGAVSKSQFLLEMKAVEVDHLQKHLQRLLNALQSLSTLYYEHKKRHLCRKLHDAAVKACACLEGAARDPLLPALDVLAAMAASTVPQRPSALVAGT